MLAIQNPAVPQAQSGRALWVFLCRSGDRLRALRRLVERRSRVFSALPGAFLVWVPEIDRAPLWTDDFSDLVGVLAPNRIVRLLDPS